MFSPYLSNPLQNYPKEVFQMSTKLKELKKAGIKYNQLHDTEKPFEYSKIRQQFIKEICNYNPSFGDKKTEEVSYSIMSI